MFPYIHLHRRRLLLIIMFTLMFAILLMLAPHLGCDPDWKPPPVYPRG
jgi:hypothetical protein